MSGDITIRLNLETLNALEKLNSFVGQAGAGLKRLASDALAAYASFEGLRKLEEGVRSAIDLQEQIGRVSEKTGLSVAVIAAFRDEAKVLNVSFEELNVSLGRFSQNIYDAATKGGTAGDAFIKMGVALTAADGSLRSTDAILADVAGWFQRTAAGAEKSRVATELFGKSGRTLIPVLNEGADGIEKMRSLGGPITEESVARAEEFNKSMRELQEVFEKIFIQVANNLLPSLMKVTGELKTLSADAETNKEVVEGLTDFFKGLVTVVSVLGLAFYQLGAAIGDSANGWVQVFAAVDEAVGTFEKHLKDLIQLLFDLAAVAPNAFEAFKLAATGRFADAREAMGEEFDHIKEDIKGVVKDGVADWSVLFETMSKISKEHVSDSGKQISDAIAQWSKLSSFLGGMWGSSPASPTPKKSSGGSAMPDNLGASDDAIKRLNEWQQISEEVFKQNVKLVESNPFESQLAKAKELLPLLEEQRSVLAEQMSDAQKQYDSARDEDAKIAAKKQILKIQGETNDLLAQENKIRAESTFSGQVASQWTKMLDSTENFSKDASKLLLSPVEGFRQGFANALDEMLVKGRFSFSTLAIGMLSTIRQAFVQMVADWLVSHVIMKGISLAFHALLSALGWAHVGEHAGQEAAKKGISLTAAGTQVAALVPIAVAMSALWATPAALATIASYGGAAVAAPGLIAIAEGLTLAESIAPREGGGPVSRGVPYLVGEKRAEVFVPDQSGRIVPSVASFAAGFGRGGSESPSLHNNFQFHFVDDQSAAARKARENPEWNHVVIDIANRNAHFIGRRE